MKILIATGLYPPEVGGPATYTKLLETELPKRGIEVAVLPFSEVRALPSGVRHAVYFLKALARARGCEIIYAQDAVSVGVPASWAAKLLGKKFVVRVPGDFAWEQSVQRFGVKDSLDDFQTKKYGHQVERLRRAQRAVVARAAAVVVPSDYMKNVVANWSVPAQKITRIYSSVEVPEPAAVEHRAGFLVVSSGRPVSWKHFDAIERVVAREPSWKFFLIQNMPRAQALGWVKAADVFVLNSTYEGLSHALVEAMMLGTPVVATRVGGNPELITDGVEGLLIPPGDDEALYQALKKIAQDPQAARARAEAARAKTAQFSIDTAVGELVQLLQTL